MSAPKWILIGTVTLFSIIGIVAVVKKGSQKQTVTAASTKGSTMSGAETRVVSVPAAPKKILSKKEVQPTLPTTSTPAVPTTPPIASAKDDFPNIDRIFQLFTTGASKLPIIETINYASSVPWLKGRPAWIADYATYYNTSRHFIARSLNGRTDYFSQKVAEGSKFNVFRKEKKVNFWLLVDISRCKMGFYYVDLDTDERVLLKTYRVGLGRVDGLKPAGTLTPLGRYSLGSRVAIYKPGMMGFHQDQKVEMIQVFGTRWIPLDQQLDRGAIPAKGYGLQGAPWVVNPDTGQMVENRESIGAYDSDGCIRLSSEDIEELFAIVLTKPTFIEIVKDFHEAKLPGVEVAAPSR
ncbi:MAG: L,D-transpeptidase [Rhabdochlamydiaceae bacterium]